MNTREIEKLIEKFYNGESTVEEESHLKEYFQQDEIAPHLASLKPHFDFIKDEKKKNLQDKNFETRFEDSIEDEKIISLVRLKRLKWQLSSAVAAFIILFIGIFSPFSDSSNHKQTSSEEMEAIKSLQETQKWLRFSARKINQGLSSSNNIQKFNEKLDATANMLNKSRHITKASK